MTTEVSTSPEGFMAVALAEAYKLITPGRPVLVASKGRHYNLAPIAWNTPLDYEPVTKLLFVCDPAHQTAVNAKREKAFAICVPVDPNDQIVERCGSVSDPDADKFAAFAIPYVAAKAIDVRIPSNCAGWVECRLIRAIPEGSVEIFLGEAVAAFRRIP